MESTTQTFASVCVQWAIQVTTVRWSAPPTVTSMGCVSMVPVLVLWAMAVTLALTTLLWMRRRTISVQITVTSMVCAWLAIASVSQVPFLIDNRLVFNF